MRDKRDVFVVDERDRKRWGKYAWRIDANGYVSATIDGRRVRLHRAIMGEPKGMHVHHRDGNPLNNRRENLAVLTPREHSRSHLPRRRPILKRLIEALERRAGGKPAPSV